MSQLNIQYPPGATPLDPNDLDGLLPAYITKQSELNQLERENILEATIWALGKRSHDCLNVSFCLELHRRMFSKVWSWAGTTRKTDKNIGVPWAQINTKLKVLFEDTVFWIQENTYSLDETAVRFHHRLVSIHAFPNGNGRHARLLTEVLQTVNGVPPFTWGGGELIQSQADARLNYLLALRAADNGDLSMLKAFART